MVLNIYVYNLLFLNIDKYNKLNYQKDFEPLKFEKSIKLENAKFQFLKNKNNQKQFKISNLDLEIKVKVFDLGLNDCNPRYRVRFNKKRGDLSSWYSLLQDMKDAVLDEVLLAPKAH